MDGDKRYIRDITAFKMILNSFSEKKSIFGDSNTSRYARKFIKLFCIGLVLLLFSSAIFFGVLDIGINSSNFQTDLGGGFIEKLKELKQVSSAEVNEKSFLFFTINQNEIGSILEWFVDRSNSIVIYIGMLILLVLFNITVFLRLRYLWTNYLDQYEINELIMSKITDGVTIINSGEVYQLGRTVKKNSALHKILLVPFIYLANIWDNITGYRKKLEYSEYSELPDWRSGKRICYRFINRIFKSHDNEQNKDFFSEHYNDFKILEEDRAYIFDDSSYKNAVWIIRLGIFGTLLGIAIAFFQLYVAMGSIEIGFEPGKGGITEDFIKLVQQALLGNGIAVATSLTAHGATLLLEIGISFFLRKENNLEWLNNTYEDLLQYIGFVKDSVQTAEASATNLSKNINVINMGIDSFNHQMNQATPNVSAMNSSLVNLGNHLSTLDTSFSAISNNMIDFEKQTSSTLVQFQKIDVRMNDFYKVADKIASSVETLEKSVGNISKETEKFSTFLNLMLKTAIDMGKDTTRTFQKSWKEIDEKLNT